MTESYEIKSVPWGYSSQIINFELFTSYFELKSLYSNEEILFCNPFNNFLQHQDTAYSGSTN